MKKLLKITVSVVLLGLVACVVLAVVFVTSVDINRFKGQITHWVQAKTGRNFVIAGNIERSFFPWVGLKIHGARLYNAPGFEPSDNFAYIGELDVQVKFMPLLHSKIEVGKLTVKDLNLNLTKDAQGRGSWEDITGRNRSPAALAAAPAVIKSEINSSQRNWSLSLANVEFENATIYWIDLQKQQQLGIKNLHVKAKNIAENSEFPVTMQFNLISNKPKLSGKFSLDGKVFLDSNQQIYNLKDFKFVGLMDGLPKLEFFATDVKTNLKQYTLSAPKIRLSFGSLKANANLNMTQLLGQPLFNGGLYTSSFDLKQLLNEMGIKIVTRDPKALEQVMINTGFNGTLDKLYFNPLNLKLDGSDITGSLTLGFKPQAINFALKSDLLNLDRYLPSPESTGAEVSATTVTTTTTTISPAPAQTPAVIVTEASLAPPATKFSTLSKLKVNGSLNVAQLTVANTILRNFYTQILLNNGVVQLNPLTANVYGGNTRGQVVIDIRRSLPHITIDETLGNVQISQLMKSERLTGHGTIETHLVMQGRDKNSLLTSLEGSLKFAIQNGALLGVNIPYQIDKILAMVRKDAAPVAPAGANKTDFGIFTGSGVFNRGVFSNNDLLMQSDQFKLTGAGTVNMLNQGLEYRVNVVGLKEGQERSLQLPLLITGTISQPIITPDIEAIAKTLLKEKIQDKIEEFKQNRAVQPEELKRKAGQLLQRFLH